MDKLLKYFNALPKDARASFVVACGISEGYLRKAVSEKQRFRSELCISIERETRGAVTCEDLDPSADWGFIRATASRQPKRRRTTQVTPP